MENNDLLQRHNKILGNLCHLPKKILSNHGHNAVADLVLYELCGTQCFNLKKAAYFIDNPDFDCMRGVAGFDNQEDKKQCRDGWCKPDEFNTMVNNFPFNQKVKNMQRPSGKCSAKAERDVAEELAHDLGIIKPLFHSWDMKHDNHGLFIFEKADEDDGSLDELMQNGICLLSFCPAFP